MTVRSVLREAERLARLRPYDEFRTTTTYIAACSRCRSVCAYWDDEDLDENGDLLHECDGEKETPAERLAADFGDDLSEWTV